MRNEHGQSVSSRRAARLSLGAKAFAVAVVAGVISGFAPTPAQAFWGGSFRFFPPKPASTGPDQSWLMDVPEKPGAHPKNKVAVFVFKGDDVYQPLRAAVVRTLRRRGLIVTATLKPVDSAAQYRELAQATNLAVFVQGEMAGEGARQSAQVHLYSGVTGQRITSIKFQGPTQKIVGDIGRTLWTRSGPAIKRACSSASRPRRLEREPLRIEAGSPVESTATDGQDT
jgi:hypothetical protein